MSRFIVEFVFISQISGGVKFVMEAQSRTMQCPLGLSMAESGLRRILQIKKYVLYFLQMFFILLIPSFSFQTSFQCTSPELIKNIMKFAG